MELRLSLGDATKSVANGGNNTYSDQEKTNKTIKSDLGFCMALGLNSSSAHDVSSEEHDLEDHDQEILDHDHHETISQGDDMMSVDNNQDMKNSTLQLNLLPLAHVSKISSHLQSSDHHNGSSENGSSGNKDPEVESRALDVNRIPVEEVSSANRVGLHMDLGMYGLISGNANLIRGNKRDRFEADGNDVLEADKASDEDVNIGLINTRKKLRLSKVQSAILEESFKEHHTLTPKQKQVIAKQLNLRPRQVEVWFQNRRARTKLKQTEVDCEYLRRCCETLTDENRRLQNELQELRALKTTSSPFYTMQLPATTRTMCPSCERVATTPPTTLSSTVTIASNAASDAIVGSIKTITFPLTIARPR